MAAAQGDRKAEGESRESDEEDKQQEGKVQEAQGGREGVEG